MGVDLSEQAVHFPLGLGNTALSLTSAGITGVLAASDEISMRLAGLLQVPSLPSPLELSVQVNDLTKDAASVAIALVPPVDGFAWQLTPAVLADLVGPAVGSLSAQLPTAVLPDLSLHSMRIEVTHDLGISSAQLVAAVGNFNLPVFPVQLTNVRLEVELRTVHAFDWVADLVFSVSVGDIELPFSVQTPFVDGVPKLSLDPKFMPGLPPLLLPAVLGLVPGLPDLMLPILPTIQLLALDLTVSPEFNALSSLVVAAALPDDWLAIGPGVTIVNAYIVVMATFPEQPGGRVEFNVTVDADLAFMSQPDRHVPVSLVIPTQGDVEMSLGRAVADLAGELGAGHDVNRQHHAQGITLQMLGDIGGHGVADTLSGLPASIADRLSLAHLSARLSRDLHTLRNINATATLSGWLDVRVLRLGHVAVNVSAWDPFDDARSHYVVIVGGVLDVAGVAVPLVMPLPLPVPTISLDVPPLDWGGLVLPDWPGVALPSLPDLFAAFSLPGLPAVQLPDFLLPALAELRLVDLTVELPDLAALQLLTLSLNLHGLDWLPLLPFARGCGGSVHVEIRRGACERGG